MNILMNENFLIKAEKIGQTFLNEDGNRIEVLHNISFEVKEGEFLTILGPSGCGKSTLLRILVGITKQSRGEVVFSSTGLKSETAAVFQSFALFPWLTAYENVEFGLKMRGFSDKDRERLVKEHLQETGLTRFENSYPKDLSGGMKQRVGIARALAISPRILLMDEPFSSLDVFTATKLRREVLEFWVKDKMTVVMVTHLVDEAIEMADRVLVMTPRPGKIEATIEVGLPRPRNTRSPEFFQLVDKIIDLVKV